MAGSVRRGLVLGAGGVLGAAWMIGALEALERSAGVDARDVDAVVGTSAGSVLAAFVGAGVSTRQLVDHQRGIISPGDPRIEYDYDGQPTLPPWPLPLPGSRRLVAAALRHPRRVTPAAVFSAFLPVGRGSGAPIGDLVTAALDSAVAAGRVASGGWPAPPDGPVTWIVATDYETGRRVPFGRADAPRTALSTAVTASCAIPGWYAPVTVDGHRYVDGGACSSTSLDLFAPLGLDEIHVLAPMAAFSYDRPRSAVARAERRVRRGVTRRLLHEAAKVRATGTRITLVTPGPDDLAAMGANMMDTRRRERVFQTARETTPRTLAGLASGAGLAAAG